MTVPLGLMNRKGDRMMQKMSKRMMWIIGIAVVLGLGAILSLFGVGDPPPSPTVVPTMVAKELPSSTAVPTPTAIPDTPTPQPTATPVPTATPSETSQKPSATVTPTVEEVLSAYVGCERLRVKEGGITWGQFPGVDHIYSGDPRSTGELVAGDYIRILTPDPTADGTIRVKVYPHDYRAVGKTDDQVWIYWDGLALFRLEHLAFECED